MIEASLELSRAFPFDRRILLVNAMHGAPDFRGNAAFARLGALKREGRLEMCRFLKCGSQLLGALEARFLPLEHALLQDEDAAMAAFSLSREAAIEARAEFFSWFVDQASLFQMAGLLPPGRI
jgi:hypothetical protein